MVDLSPRPIRSAIVGTGFVGPFHVDAVRRAGYGEVAVLVGSNEERTKARATALGVAAATTDLDAVLEDQTIDVVHVCTPNATHVAIARRVLEARKHVMVEKPLALSGKDADGLDLLARESGRHAAVAFTYRGYPMVRRAVQAVAAGELGDLRLLHGSYLQDWLSTETDFNWRLEPGAGQSRAVADIGSHWFDTVEHVSGLRIWAVLAEFATFIPLRLRAETQGAAFDAGEGEREPVQIESEDAAAILLRFENGARGSVVVSQVSPGRKNSFTFELAGSQATLAWDQEDPERLWIGSRGDQRVLVREAAPSTIGVPSLPAGHPEGWAEALRDLVRDFYAAIASGYPPAVDEPYPTLADGARAVRLVESVVESARTGSWTAIEDGPAKRDLARAPLIPTEDSA